MSAVAMMPPPYDDGDDDGGEWKPVKVGLFEAIILAALLAGWAFFLAVFFWVLS